MEHACDMDRTNGTAPSTSPSLVSASVFPCLREMLPGLNLSLCFPSPPKTFPPQGVYRAAPGFANRPSARPQPCAHPGVSDGSRRVVFPLLLTVESVAVSREQG